MIEFRVSISHTFEIEFKNFWAKAWNTPFRHKFIELDVYNTPTLIGCNFHWTTKRDHAGLDIELSLLGLCFHFNFYDNRHWDYEKGQWHV